MVASARVGAQSYIYGEKVSLCGRSRGLELSRRDKDFQIGSKRGREMRLTLAHTSRHQAAKPRLLPGISECRISEQVERGSGKSQPWPLL